jgi:hypothetical protein
VSAAAEVHRQRRNLQQRFERQQTERDTEGTSASREPSRAPIAFGRRRLCRRRATARDAPTARR